MFWSCKKMKLVYLLLPDPIGIFWSNVKAFALFCQFCPIVAVVVERSRALFSHTRSRAQGRGFESGRYHLFSRVNK